MSVRNKLLLSFSIILVLLVSISGFSYYKLNDMNEQYSSAIKDHLEKITLTSDLIDATTEKKEAIRGYLISGSKTLLNDDKTAEQKFNSAADQLLKLDLNSHTKLLVEKLIQQEALYKKTTDQQIELKKQNKDKEYIQLERTQGVPIIKALNKVANELSTLQKNALLDKSNQLTIGIHEATNFASIISLLAILFGLAIALYISRNISKPVQSIAKSAEQIANGNLVVNKIAINNKDEIGQLAQSFNQMTENIRGIIQQVNSTSEQVAASAEELTASSEQTSLATKQVTISIENVAKNAESLTVNADETAHTVNEMSIGIQRVADTTTTVAENALETAHQAKLGNHYIDKVIQQIHSIHSSSRNTNGIIKELHNHSSQIGQIIEVITGIAEQTNLLALNAAIESARAGEHGRGFSVVADEVKKLAEQSRESASQIAHIIHTVQADTNQAVEMMDQEINEVTEGLQLVEETGRTFHTILQAIEQVSSEIEEVSAISEEMSASVEQVNASVTEIAEIIKKTANNTTKIASATEEQLASMEEVSSSADSLEKMSEHLRD